MTTARMVFVNKKHSEEVFKSFDIPFANMFEEKFKQPIFGSNYIEGMVLGFMAYFIKQRLGLYMGYCLEMQRFIFILRKEDARLFLECLFRY
jgi:hypothetical protein